MTRNLLAIIAILLAALLPQGTVLCSGADGHFALEAVAADCCPTGPCEGSNGDSTGCQDCVDADSPDLKMDRPSRLLPARGTTCASPTALPPPATDASSPPGPISHDVPGRPAPRSVVLLL